MQIELYQEENALKHVKSLTAFPMLSATGVDPEHGSDGAPADMVVSPGQILYGGDNGSFDFIEPGSQSLVFLKDSIGEFIREMREIGRQPLTANSGNLTVVTTAFAAQKGNSALQTWAGILGLAIEDMLKVAAKWMKIQDPVIKVDVFDDFDSGFGNDKSFESILDMAKEGMISVDAAIDEAIRRNILSPNYDRSGDLLKIAEDAYREMRDEMGEEPEDDSENESEDPQENELNDSSDEET